MIFMIDETYSGFPLRYQDGDGACGCGSITVPEIRALTTGQNRWFNVSPDIPVGSGDLTRT